MRFEARVAEGHKGVKAVIVPFDPNLVFGTAPMRLAGRRHGWPVRVRLGRARFDGYVGERWGRFFVIVEDPALEAAGARAGELVPVSLEPSNAAHARAIEQSKRTTQPRKARVEEGAFARIARLLGKDPRVDLPSAGKGFGANALKARGRIFAFESKGRLVVKLPRDRVAALIASGAAAPYDPRGDGRVMKEWAAVPSARSASWLALAREALAFVKA